MIGFLIKKTFYDLWDNFLWVALLNMGFIAFLAIPVFLPGLVPIPALSLLILAAGILLCAMYLSAAALSLRAISDYGTFGFSDFFGNLIKGLPAGLLLGTLAILLYGVVSLAIPFYLSLKSLLGLFLAAVIFWAIVLGTISLQYFFAIRARLDTQLTKVFKKCFIIFFDNPGFSIFCLLVVIVALALSAVFVLLFPGPAGILLFIDEALRLRLLKYDWLEANPEPESPAKTRKRRIPWDAILIEEREKTGTRSFRDFIFPWKG